VAEIQDDKELWQPLEELPLRELLETLLGPEDRRRLKLRYMTNDGVFQLYESDLVLRLHNAKNLSDTRKVLARFKAYLNGYPPSPELAKGFLAQYADRKPRTLYRYSQMIKVFMKWYGEPMVDFKVKAPLRFYNRDYLAITLYALAMLIARTTS
jgi:hypothetical protein